MGGIISLRGVGLARVHYVIGHLQASACYVLLSLKGALMCGHDSDTAIL